LQAHIANYCSRKPFGVPAAPPGAAFNPAAAAAALAGALAIPPPPALFTLPTPTHSQKQQPRPPVADLTPRDADKRPLCEGECLLCV